MEYLIIWKNTHGIFKLVDNVLESFKRDNLDHEEVHIKEKDKKTSYNVKQCLLKVVDGHFTTVLKVSGSFEMGTYNAH